MLSVLKRYLLEITVTEIKLLFNDYGNEYIQNINMNA